MLGLQGMRFDFALAIDIFLTFTIGRQMIAGHLFPSLFVVKLARQSVARSLVQTKERKDSLAAQKEQSEIEIETSRFGVGRPKIEKRMIAVKHAILNIALRSHNPCACRCPAG